MTGKAARWIGAILLALITGITGFWMTGSLAQRQAPPGNTEASTNQVPLPAQNGPYSPEQALKLFQLADNRLTIELVASEPTIQSPVAMAFDEHGRIWVVEMPDYPNGPPPGQPPEGRIKILTDRDGDGIYETASVFADRLLFANGLQLWKQGVFVTQAPELLYLADTQGTGRAERREVWYRGFAAENPQLRLSFPTLGMDGWIYCANGLRGGQAVRLDQQGRPAGPAVSLNNMDFRFDPRKPERYEALTGPGQYGLTFDDWGERFVCDNRHHLRLVVFEQRYLRHQPNLVPPSLLLDISVLDQQENPAGAGGRVYPISRNFTTSSLHAGHFSAACGIHVYTGDALPAEYAGVVLTCEPPGNLVHAERLYPNGATLSSKPMYDGKEFLASSDDWFRPVFLTEGPDGALYVVDMYRAVIEHPEYMPPELRKRPDLLWGKEKGRIWRITSRTNRPNRRPVDGLGGRDPKDWVKLLEHRNGWHRQTAFRLLLQAVPVEEQLKSELQRLVRISPSPQARVLALWLLEHSGQLDSATLKAALTDAHVGVRQQAVKISEAHLEKPEIRQAVLDLARQFLRTSDEPDQSKGSAGDALSQQERKGRLLLQTVLTLASFPESDRLSILSRMGIAFCDDSWMRLAVLIAAGDGLNQLLMQWWNARQPAASPAGRRELLREAAAVIGASSDLRRITEAIRPLTQQRRGDAETQAILLGLADGMRRRGNRLAQWVAHLHSQEPQLASWLDHYIQQAQARAASSEASSAERLQAIQLLAQLPDKRNTAILQQLAMEDRDPQIRLAAVRGLAQHPGTEVTTALLSLWPGATPMLRRELLEALLQNRDRTLAVLEAVEQGRIKPGELDPVRVRQLLQHRDETIRKRAIQVLSASTPRERWQVLQTYRAALARPGDVARGRAVFQKHCASCHRVAGIGTNVGPDISDLRTKSPEQLLHDILLPNAAIDGNYVQYVVTTRSGRTLTGIIAAESPTSITLKRAENQTDTVLRSEIEEIQSTGLSLMPEGLEKEITIEQMADLLAFLKNWRYVSLPAGDDKPPAIRIEDREDHIVIDTDCLQARINKKGYVSGVAGGSFLDKKTGARDLGFGLHIMDFLLAPGWRDDGYTRDPKIHGRLAKHYVEGPQICTQARQLQPEIIRGADFVAVRLRFTFTQPGAGYRAGSQWTQTLVFVPGQRYFYSAEEIVSANTLPNVFYRIDMPGHIRMPQSGQPDWLQVYLSYRGLIPATEFAENFGPDEKFLYQRHVEKIPERFIRAYQVRSGEKPGPWLAGMTLEPSVVYEAWCHRRGYICMIQELHGRPVKAGETFGAAYIIGWFDSLEEMHRVYDQHKGKTRLLVSPQRWELR
jgi:putative membrane-bound dehydrogenase-like protein